MYVSYLTIPIVKQMIYTQKETDFIPKLRLER